MNARLMQVKTNVMYTTPTISKEQYDSLLKLAEGKDHNFSFDKKQYGLGDLLNTFLKEYAVGKNKVKITKN